MLFAPFTKRPKNPRSLVSLTFDESAPDAFHLAWSATLQPDAGGALNYAYESFALPLSDPLGRAQLATRIPGAVPNMLPPYYMQQTGPYTGFGIVTGSFRSQPLIDITAPGSGIVLPIGG